MEREPARLLLSALTQESASDRLQAALTAGTHPNDDYVTVLVERSGVEPDFFVRDMLTWALVRHPSELTVPLLLHEAAVGGDQARSQALHSLSKIGDPRGWSAITPELLTHANDEVARSAWRTAVVLAPDGEETLLAETLVTQLGRGDRAVQLSLSRALAELGDTARTALEGSSTRGTPATRAHAIATEKLLDDPDASFDGILHEAIRTVSLADDPTASR